jgi:phenylalanyl-tRNA synthetase beta chain
VADYFPVGETVIDVDVTPNRPDLWGMIGVARELAAILRTGFGVPDVETSCRDVPADAGGLSTRDFGLRVEAEDLCPRYDLRRVSGLAPGRQAPLWMRRRIHAASMRPINAVVDATNYVMLETGQPIHAFDAAKVRGGIVVRRGRANEKITLLDGSTRTLDEEMLVIADEERGLVIAGVMGAEDAEVGAETTDALIEVANFAGDNILRTSQRLGLRTDASGRFERGLDPNMVDLAMGRVVGLLAQNPGGHVAADTLSHYPEPVQPWRVPLRLPRAELLLGMPVGTEEAAGRLEALGCEVEAGGGDDRDRSDVPPRPAAGGGPRRGGGAPDRAGQGPRGAPRRAPARRPHARPAAAAPAPPPAGRPRPLGGDHVPLRPPAVDGGPERGERLGEGRIKNPLSAENGDLRASILPGLLDAAARNKTFGVRGGALFEVGRVFRPDPPPDGLREAALKFRMTGRVDALGPMPSRTRRP